VQNQHRKVQTGRPLSAIAAGTALAALIATGSLWSAHSIEGDLTRRSQAALASAGIDISVTFHGRDATLAGTANDDREAAAAARLVRDLPGTRLVSSQIGLPRLPATASAPTATPAASGTPSEAATSGSTSSGSASSAAAPSNSPTATTGATPNATPPPLAQGRITFGTDEALLSADAKRYLITVAGYLRQYPQVHVSIEGHADDVGPAEVNWSLSQERAQAVSAYLVSAGVPAMQLKTTAFGDTRPIASNNSAAGRAANRRVEIVVVEAG
jgi:outer membrane protein OmpA-like peptidoglycan-associated protein